jgi:hypothetical protein
VTASRCTLAPLLTHRPVLLHLLRRCSVCAVARRAAG